MPKKLPSSLLPPIAGIDIDAVAVLIPSITIAPIAGIDSIISSLIVTSETIAPCWDCRRRNMIDVF